MLMCEYDTIKVILIKTTLIVITSNPKIFNELSMLLKEVGLLYLQKCRKYISKFN